MVSLSVFRKDVECIVEKFMSRGWRLRSRGYCPHAVYCSSSFKRNRLNGNSKSFKMAQNTTSEAKGQQFTVGKVIQSLFSIDPFTYLAIYRYR